MLLGSLVGGIEFLLIRNSITHTVFVELYASEDNLQADVTVDRPV